MKKITYSPKGVCSRQIELVIDGDVIASCKFVGGCAGNTQGVSALVIGMNVDEAINRLNQQADDIDVFPFVEPTYVVRIADTALVKNQINSTRMILYIKPVAHIFALTIHRQRSAVTNVINKQRYQLLGELIWAVVIRTVRNDSRHSVCIVERTHKVVARSL